MATIRHFYVVFFFHKISHLRQPRRRSGVVIARMDERRRDEWWPWDDRMCVKNPHEKNAIIPKQGKQAGRPFRCGAARPLRVQREKSVKQQSTSRAALPAPSHTSPTGTQHNKKCVCMFYSCVINCWHPKQFLHTDTHTHTLPQFTHSHEQIHVFVYDMSMSMSGVRLPNG